MVTKHNVEAFDWVLLIYRVPREPSSPRIAVWRKLRELGVAQLGDGLVALPDDARTREHLEWVADQVIEAGGTALLLRAQTLARQDERALARSMARARALEYQELAARAAEVEAVAPSPNDRTRALKRLRADLRRVTKRDYFPPVERDEAVAAVNRLASALSGSQPFSRTPLVDRS